MTLSTLQAVAQQLAMQLQQLEAPAGSVQTPHLASRTHQGGVACTTSLLSKLEEALSDVLDSAAAAAWWPGRQPKQGAPKLSAPAAADV